MIAAFPRSRVIRGRVCLAVLFGQAASFSWFFSAEKHPLLKINRRLYIHVYIRRLITSQAFSKVFFFCKTAYVPCLGWHHVLTINAHSSPLKSRLRQRPQASFVAFVARDCLQSRARRLKCSPCSCCLRFPGFAVACSCASFIEKSRRTTCTLLQTDKGKTSAFATRSLSERHL